MCTGGKSLKIQKNKEPQWDNLQQYTNPIGNSRRVSTRVYPHEENQVKAEHNREQNIEKTLHNPMAFLNRQRWLDLEMQKG